LAALTNDEGKLPSTIAFERGASEDMIAFFLKKMEEENREKCVGRSALCPLWAPAFANARVEKEY
jgi:hypothetical protein